MKRTFRSLRFPAPLNCPSLPRNWRKAARFDAVICLGAVIRGATPHFEYISAEVSKGIATVGLETEVPVAFGVLTTDTIEQAIERAGTKAGNKGWDAAMSAIEMVDPVQKIVTAAAGHRDPRRRIREGCMHQRRKAREVTSQVLLDELTFSGSTPGGHGPVLGKFRRAGRGEKTFLVSVEGTWNNREKIDNLISGSSELHHGPDVAGR